MADKLRFEFPWPPHELSPNWRGHHMALARAKARYREDCGWEAFAQTNQDIRAGWPLTSPVTAQVTFRNDRRRRDPDNCMASLKAMWDALVDVGLLEDDNKDVLTILPPKWEVGKPLVIVELEGA